MSKLHETTAYQTCPTLDLHGIEQVFIILSYRNAKSPKWSQHERGCFACSYTNEIITRIEVEKQPVIYSMFAVQWDEAYKRKNSRMFSALGVPAYCMCHLIRQYRKASAIA